MKIVDYAIALCEFEMLDKIKGKYFQKYLLNYPDDIKEEIQELEEAMENIVDQVNKYRLENEQVFKKIASDLNIIDGKINIIEFVRTDAEVGLILASKEVKIDNYIKEAYKRFNSAWKLDVKDIDIKAVKKYATEDILNM